MKYRKRIQILPGIKINISRTGISSTMGIPGASVNIGKDGAFLNTGIPGTGLYDRHKIISAKGSSKESEDSDSLEKPRIDPEYGEINYLESQISEELASDTMLNISETLNNIFTQKIDVSRNIRELKIELDKKRRAENLSKIFIVGLILPLFKGKIQQIKNEITELETDFDNCKINIDVQFDDIIENKFKELLESFKVLCFSEKIWDNVASVSIDKNHKSAGKTGVHLEEVNFKLSNINIIESKFPGLCLENFNGNNIYIYPSFAIILSEALKFLVIDLKEIHLGFNEQEMIYTDEPPMDSRRIGETWLKVNKDGSPDKRFSGNRQLPILLLGKLTFKTDSGLNEVYSISDHKKAEDFFNKFLAYTKELV